MRQVIFSGNLINLPPVSSSTPSTIKLISCANGDFNFNFLFIFNFFAGFAKHNQTHSWDLSKTNNSTNVLFSNSTFNLAFITLVLFTITRSPSLNSSKRFLVNLLVKQSSSKKLFLTIINLDSCLIAEGLLAINEGSSK